MSESFGPEYVRPMQKACLRCGCCSEALCAKGRNSVRRCLGHTGEAAREVVAGCPCSAEWTRHTAAWRAAQVRVTRLARELPVVQEAVGLLRALARGARVEDPAGVLPQLQIRGLARLVSGLPAITPLGHTYLGALEDVRALAAVRVLTVEAATGTVRVEVPVWRPDTAVTVLLDQVCTDTGLNPGALPGRWLEAEANCGAPTLERLVLTHFRESDPLGLGGMHQSAASVTEVTE